MKCPKLSYVVAVPEGRTSILLFFLTHFYYSLVSFSVLLLLTHTKKKRDHCGGAVPYCLVRGGEAGKCRGKKKKEAQEHTADKFRQ